MRDGQLTINNGQVIAVFVLGVALLLAAFWAGLNVVKQDSIAAPNYSSAVQKGRTEQTEKPSSSEQEGDELRYLVRVGAFGTAERANQLSNELRKKYQSAYTQNPDAESPLYRVNIGPYASRREAAVIADELTAQGLKGVIILPWKQD